MIDLVSAFQKLGNELRKQVGAAHIKMELPASLYNILRDEADRRCRYGVHREFGSTLIELQTACGIFTFTKKTCKECGHDL